MPSPSLPPYSFGQVMPSQPCSPTLAMNWRRIGRVDDLGHVLPGDVEDLRVVVGVEELLDLLDEFELLGGELEVHVGPPSAGLRRRRVGFLTDRQILWTS